MEATTAELQQKQDDEPTYLSTRSKQAQHSAAGTGFRDGTRYFVDSEKAWTGSQPESSASS